MSKTKKQPPVVRQFYVDLTDEELRQRGDSLAEMERRHNAITAEKKAAAAEFKSKLDKLNADIDFTAGEIRDKKTLRSIDCFWVRDEGRKQMVLERSDNGQALEHRAMTDKELQAELPGTEAPEGEQPAEAAPAEPKKKRGRPKKNAAPEQANGAAHDEPAAETPATV